MSEKQTYYVRRRGRTDGPWTFDKLQAEISLRKLGRHHEISEDKATWFHAGELAELFPAVEVQKIVGQHADGFSSVGNEATIEDELELETSEQVQWYCAINNEQLGPMDTASLRQFLLSGQCALDDLVWRDGYTEWVPAESVPELIAEMNTNHLARANDREEETRLIELPPRQCTAAQTSLILGVCLLLVSWIPLFGFLGIAPIVVALIAFRQISASDGQLLGKNSAVAGTVLGLVSIIVAIVVLIVGVAFWANQ